MQPSQTTALAPDMSVSGCFGTSVPSSLRCTCRCSAPISSTSRPKYEANHSLWLAAAWATPSTFPANASRSEVEGPVSSTCA